MKYFTKASLLKLADASAGLMACRILRAFCRHDSRHHDLSFPADMKDPSILVIRPGGMGDMIVLLPALRSLANRFPAARITIACETRNIGILEMAGLPVIPIAYDSNPLKFMTILHTGNFDIVIDSEQFHHFSAVFSFITRAGMRIGFNINPVRNPFYTHLVPYSPDKPEGEQFMKLLAPIGITDRFIPSNAFPPGYLASASLPGSGLPAKYAVFHPCPSSVKKQWYPERFGDLAGMLQREYGLSTVLLGHKHDMAMHKLIIESADAGTNTIISMARDSTLRETAGIIGGASLYVGVDSALAHLAVAMDIPSVTLFGPSDCCKWGYMQGTHSFVRARTPCAPCFIFGYSKPCKTIDCMNSIGVEEVMKECEKALNPGAF